MHIKRLTSQLSSPAKGAGLDSAKKRSATYFRRYVRLWPTAAGRVI